MDYSNQKDKTIIVREKGKVHQIFFENIVYVECDGYVSKIHTNDELKPISCSVLLKEIEEKVEGYGFYRINRKTIINLKYFKSYIWLSPPIIGQFVFVLQIYKNFTLSLHQQGTTEGDL